MASIQNRQTDSGRRYDVVFREPGGKQKRKTFTDEREASRFAITVEADKLRGRYVDLSNPLTLSEYAAQWLESRPHRPSTRSRTRSMLRAHVDRTPLGRRRLVEIRKTDVQGWVTERSTVLAPSSLALLVKIIKAVLAAAVEDELLAKSPAVTVTLPDDDRRLDTTRLLKDPNEPPLTVAQVRALADASMPRHRALVLVQAGLGLRIGELLALRTSDVNFLRRTVTVTEQIEPRSRERVPLKTRRSRRTVPLPQPVVDALAEHMAAFPPTDGGLIFSGATTGKPYAREVVSRALRRAVEKAGLPPTTTAHDLRRHCASLLVDSGMSVVEVAKWIGDTPEQIAKTYARPMPSWEDKARRAVEAAWATERETTHARQV